MLELIPSVECSRQTSLTYDQDHTTDVALGSSTDPSQSTRMRLVVALLSLSLVQLRLKLHLHQQNPVRHTQLDFHLNQLDWVLWFQIFQDQHTTRWLNR